MKHAYFSGLIGGVVILVTGAMLGVVMDWPFWTTIVIGGMSIAAVETWLRND